MKDKLCEMVIDETGIWRPTKYAKDKVTTTDHNTIVIKVMLRKISRVKSPAFYQVRNAEQRQLYVQNIVNDVEMDSIFRDGMDGLDAEFTKFNNWWGVLMDNSFKKVSRGSKVKPGICEKVKELLQKERWIKQNILDNPERGKMIYNVRKEIREKIEANNALELVETIKKVSGSRNPHAEVFKIRKRLKKVETVGFPLKDIKGNLHVDQLGIDQVINHHFTRVFKQLEVPKGEIWHKYWQVVDDVYQMLRKVNSSNSEDNKPVREDIFRLIRNLKTGKAVNGNMSIDLVKLGGEKLWDLIFRCVCWCFEAEEIPLDMRIEKMILLYKHAGEIDVLDNYRGIFLRHVILSIIQKWLYTHNAGIVDSNGSELAFGGRVDRSVQEALLIVRLIQDHAWWSGESLYIKFMDVQKFFDTMNFRKALIDAHLSGVRGKDWKMYDIINKFTTGILSIDPLGFEIIMEEVFVQGSADAVLMAWNTMDARNKRDVDRYDSEFVIEGILLNGVIFIDDIVVFARTELEVIELLVSDEVFQRSNRLRFKPVKCKIILINVGDGAF